MGFWSSNKKTDDKKSDSKPSSDEVTIIDFGEVLDISFAAKLHSQLKDEVVKNSTVNFSTSSLTRVDASCLQMLESFMSYAKENNIDIDWGEPSDVIVEATRLTGLTNALDLNI